jgi:hypothetical protein
VISGFLLSTYCPDPTTLPAGITEVQRAAYYVNAHYIWYYFAAIGIIAAIALYVFKVVTERIDDAGESQNNNLQ